MKVGLITDLQKNSPGPKQSEGKDQSELTIFESLHLKEVMDREGIQTATTQTEPSSRYWPKHNAVTKYQTIHPRRPISRENTIEGKAVRRLIG